MAHKHKLHKTLHAVHFSFSAGLALLSAGLLAVYILAPAVLVYAGSGNAPFASGSVWNTALPRHPQLAANSTALSANVAAQVSSYGASVDTTDKGAPVYVDDGTNTPVSVTPWGCSGPADTSLTSPWSAVPIPPYAQPSSGPSGRMLVYQPSTATVWEFSQMYKSGGQWFACKGGRIADTSVTSGVFSGQHGVNTSSLALLAGQISLADLQRGRVDHTVGLSLPQVSGSVSWPAVRGGSGGVISMGTRLQLDPTLDINALGLSAYGKMVARAAQTYGFVVWDTGSSVSVQAENPLTNTSHGAPSPYGSTSLAGFPWDKLRALPANYGLSGHLPQIHHFTASKTAVSQHERIQLSWSAVNIHECAIPGVQSHLGSSGTATTEPLVAASMFTLSCSGPNGHITRSLNVSVPTGEKALPPPPPQALNITNPIGGRAHIVAELLDPAVLASIYKVAYYQREKLLEVTTESPYSLNTESLADGKYDLTVKLYHRDGSEQTQKISAHIVNHPISILAAIPPQKLNARNMTPIFALGMVGCFLIMIATGYIGWRKVPHNY